MAKSRKHFYRFGPFRFDVVNHSLSEDGSTISLTPRLFNALRVFVEHNGRVLTKEELKSSIWHRIISNESLKKVVSDLRIALDDTKEPFQYIANVRGTGYIFLAKVDIEYEDENHSTHKRFSPPVQIELDYIDIKVLKALDDSGYALRSPEGIARDIKLDINEVKYTLAWLRAIEVVELKRENCGLRWCLTNKGLEALREVDTDRLSGTRRDD